MGREYGAIPRAITTRDNLRMIRKMELECLSGETATNIKASSLMMQGKARVKWLGVMAVITKEIGKGAFPMESVYVSLSRDVSREGRKGKNWPI